MKTRLFTQLFTVIVILLSFSAFQLQAQSDYKHPQVNAKGEVMDENGVKLGWVTKEGLINNAEGKKVAFIDAQGNVVDAQGKKLGRVGKNNTYYNAEGTAVFTVSPAKGEQCQVLDPKGKVIASVHESYKNQACAIHCLNKK
jgi:hypothetical protein